MDKLDNGQPPRPHLRASAAGPRTRASLPSATSAAGHRQPCTDLPLQPDVVLGSLRHVLVFQPKRVAPDCLGEIDANVRPSEDCLEIDLSTATQRNAAGNPNLKTSIAHHKKLGVDVGQQENDPGERLRRLLRAMAFNRLESHTLLSDSQTEKRVAVR